MLVNEEDLIHFAEAPFRVLRQSPTGQSSGTIAKNVCDEALALVQFDRMMSERLVRPHFQVILDIEDDKAIGFEVLGRGSVFGLESVGAMFQAAEQLNLEVELSRLLRWEGIRVGRDLPGNPTLFVNTHPKEMTSSAGLIESLEKVREMSGNTDLVLEIHEAAVTNRQMLNELSSAMKDLDIKLAFDEFRLRSSTAGRTHRITSGLREVRYLTHSRYRHSRLPAAADAQNTRANGSRLGYSRTGRRRGNLRRSEYLQGNRIRSWSGLLLGSPISGVKY